MNYIIAVYADDYLQLFELLSRIDMDMPLATVKVFATDALVESLPQESAQELSSDISGLSDADLVIFLSRLPEADERLFAERFQGTVIDASDSSRIFEYDDVRYISDPLISHLVELAEMNDLHINLGLPLAIYGKKGIDLLMQETRAVYTFEDYDNDILPSRVAFNVHFYQNLPNCRLNESVEKLKSMAKVSLRINPVSTVFVADIFCVKEIEFGSHTYIDHQSDIFLDQVGQDNGVTSTTHGGVVRLLQDEHSCTLIGDYLHLKTGKIYETAKLVLGV